MNDAQIAEWLRNEFMVEKAEKVEHIQALWSGYGEIARYVLTGDGQSRSLVVKHINLHQQTNHPRAWSGQRSHERKVSSYFNEQVFYQAISPVLDQGVLNCKVPACMSTQHSDQHILLVLEDLNASGFRARYTDINPSTQMNIVHATIEWLACFHASMLSVDTSKLWAVGTYWHLGTREDEWQVMPNSALKSAAKEIDAILNNAQYQTLLHGDAKLANFCYSRTVESSTDIAAVDFQYTGKGAGIKDLVYFLGSCFDESALTQHAQHCIEHYFTCLNSAVRQLAPDADIQALEAEWRHLEVFAWADFERFLSGWAPSHFKLNAYSELKTQTALANLNKE